MALIPQGMLSRAFAFLALSQLGLGMTAFADTPGPTPTPSPSPSQCPDCQPPTKQVCFTLACTYNNPNNPTGYKACQVQSTFNKLVTLDGGEVPDTSTLANDPTLLLVCDG